MSKRASQSAEPAIAAMLDAATKCLNPACDKSVSHNNRGYCSRLCHDAHPPKLAYACRETGYKTGAELVKALAGAAGQYRAELLGVDRTTLHGWRRRYSTPEELAAQGLRRTEQHRTRSKGKAQHVRRPRPGDAASLADEAVALSAARGLSLVTALEQVAYSRGYVLMLPKAQ